MRTAIVDSLPEPGGQISALYPEKLIYDIAGFPQVRGRDLVSGLVDQAEKFGPTCLLGHSADGLEHLDGGRLRITTTQGSGGQHRAVVIAGGIGTFSPRPLPAGAGCSAAAWYYFVTASGRVRRAGRRSSSAAGTARSTGRTPRADREVGDARAPPRPSSAPTQRHRRRRCSRAGAEVITQARGARRSAGEHHVESGGQITTNDGDVVDPDPRRRWSPPSASSPTSARCRSGAWSSRTGTSRSTPR